MQQRESEDRKLRNDLAELCKFMGMMSSAQLPLTPPMDTGRFLPAPQQQYAQPFRPQQVQLPPSPPQNQQVVQPRLEEIAQMTFENTQQGHEQYRAAMEQFVCDHPCTTIQPPTDKPYPLTPGTVPAGTNECHRCGQRGHFIAACTNPPVPQAEQHYRRQYGANSRDRRRQGNA
ncbi:uncharacterized protein UTRI_10378 [Ustilago trichophora]|uniref:CCHC-type domain-containing protein n=1 Tax=Ustilago trichophora TaxID=86804 RepID=A0A5C3EC72_9BASI|nr:uncharacterized protein UTRI_10378 [Ustilago trichophora]